ncbi:ETX/MTX2 family pore-forming toxin [Spiroplasma endosymbiont of Seladonia tumulorum]|uniref:ETX/MTX2 family pore-forming toxin n=1 Tax=Spiroplasma endosymbiont of Seladonia tumulorum TaxID=3066321 RepID=UPI0030CB20DF
MLNNKLYIGSDDNNVYEYDPLELIESEIINIQEQIKRGLYLYYKKQNPSYEIKKIYNINLENLTLSDVTLKQTQKNKSSNLEQDINDFCKDSDSTFINNSSIEQTQNTVSCSKQLTETNTFQKMNGFSKSELTSNTENWNWNVNGKVTVKTSSNAGVPLVFGAKLEVSVEVGAGKTWGGSKNYTIGEVTNSSNTEIKTTTETMTINVPSQPVKIPPHSKISISVNAWKNNIVLILSYYQKVQGMVSADFLDKNNNRTTVSISIKDAMSSLLENNILPSKIIINNDNSIKFSYDIKSQKEIIMHQTEIGEAIPLNSYEQNETFKDNTMGVGL